MANKVKNVVNKAAGATAPKANRAGYLFGGIALAAFGVSFVADVVEALTASDDVPVIEVTEEE